MCLRCSPKEMNTTNNIVPGDVPRNICTVTQSMSSHMWGCLGCFVLLCALDIPVITNLGLKSSVLLYISKLPP
jgi:hypothetical protein